MRKLAISAALIAALYAPLSASADTRTIECGDGSAIITPAQGVSLSPLGYDVLFTCVNEGIAETIAEAIAKKK